MPVPPAAFLASMALALLSSRSAYAQVEVAHRSAPLSSPAHEYGNSLAVEGEWAFVGAPGTPGAGDRPQMGAVHAWHNGPTGWQEVQVLVSRAVHDYDRLGTSVSVSGNTLAAGTLKGRLQLYRFDGVRWRDDGELRSPAGASARLFGVFVDVDGDRLAVSDQWEDGVGVKSGATYVYVRSAGAWSLEQRVAPLGVAADDFAGYPALHGNTLLVGSPGRGGGRGALYVFERAGPVWSQQLSLAPLDLEPSDSFGGRIAFDGETALVGATRGDGAAPDSGVAYVYSRLGTTWLELGRLAAPRGTSADGFGIGLDIAGDTAVIGAAWGDGRDVGSGTAFAFRRNGFTWELAGELLPREAGRSDSLGFACALGERTALVGAPGDDRAAPGAGAVHEFRLLGDGVTLVSDRGLNQDALGTDVAAIGATFGATIGVRSAHADGHVFLFVSNGTAAGQVVLGGRGEWLLGVRRFHFLASGIHGGAGTTVALTSAVPNNPALLGTTWAAQAVVGGGPLTLTNAVTGVVR